MLTSQGEGKKNLLMRARAQAVNVLIEENEERFHTLYAEKAQDLGVTYVRPETPESRARKQLEELRDTFPEEWAKLTQQGQPEGQPSVDGSTVTEPDAG